MDQVAENLIIKINKYSESLDPCAGVDYEADPSYYQAMTFRKLIKDLECKECIKKMSYKIDEFLFLDKEKEEKNIAELIKKEYENKKRNYEIELKKLNRLKEELNISQIKKGPKIITLICNECNKHGTTKNIVTYQLDPFLTEVTDSKEYRNLCEKCYIVQCDAI